ncbi:MAG: hypothetical protein ACTSQJ_02515 [Promethearchaeota archaeon]
MFEIILSIFWSIIKIVIYIAILSGIGYIILPWIFKKFVSPKFNASYIYNSNDFDQKKKISDKSEQNNIPTVIINRETGTFNINFGENRNIAECILKIRYNQQIYTNYKDLNKNYKRLILKEIEKLKDSENLGQFESTIFTYQLEGENIEIIATIKEFNGQNFIIFGLLFLNGLSNTATGKYKDLITMFPSFLNKSPNKNIFTFRHAIFCPPDKNFKATSAPVLFYDDDLNCFIVSAFDGFLNNAISKTKDKRINCGFQGEIKEIPKNSNQEFIIIFGKGINSTFEQLGELLRRHHNIEKKDPYGSIAVSHLSYWTDNGAYYYYMTEKGMTYEDTIIAIKEYFEKHKIPIQAYNFDSWWYLKYLSPFKKFLSRTFKPLYRLLGGGLFGNTIKWETDPNHFSTDLATFYRERFKYPIIAHSRRWDARSPYLKKFTFQVYKNHAVPLNKDFWDWCMKHAKESGIEVYEQDWMKTQVKSIPVLREEFKAKEEWLNNMAIAGRENNVDIFYCMMTPEMLLYSIKHPNIVMARCSGDYNHRWPLNFRFIFCTQTCILFNAMGINPHQDVFRSTYERFGEHYPELKCLVEILTAGVVAPGDKMEKVNWSLLKKTCREDGLLLKPDKPLTANDLMFKKHRKYYICDTYTKRGDYIWHYILIVNIWPKNVKETYISARELGFKEKEFILYDFQTGLIFPMKNTEQLNLGFLNKYEYRYYIFCPLFENKMAIIGCIDKFITCSKKQFLLIESTEESLTFSFEDIKGASQKILLYSETKPSSIQIKNGDLISENGEKNSWKYISATKKIELNLFFNKSEIKTIKITK